jgi:hypothetical protein
METISEAKVYLKENFEKGCKCPACDQLVKLWKYSIHSTMARLLIELYVSGGEYHHINELWERVKKKSNIKTDHCGDFSKLTYWGFIEPMVKNPEENKRASGYWKITDKGKDFVKGKSLAVKTLLVFDQRVYKTEGKIDILGALKKKFDYFELLA